MRMTVLRLLKKYFSATMRQLTYGDWGMLIIGCQDIFEGASPERRSIAANRPSTHSKQVLKNQHLAKQLAQMCY